MKHFLQSILCLSIFVFFSITLKSQDEAPADASTFTFVLNQDNAFGFYPQVFGSSPLKGNRSFTYYGIFWTNPTYGSPDLGGSDNWLETGVGINFSLKENTLNINPSIGFTHGKLLSGGERGVLAEGIAPSITTFYVTKKWDVEIFGTYYKVLRKEGEVTADYLLYWVLPGYNLNEKITLGAHYENFVLTRETAGESASLYQCIGAFIKFNANQKYFYRLSAGANLNDDFYSKEFYKLSAVFFM